MREAKIENFLALERSGQECSVFVVEHMLAEFLLSLLDVVYYVLEAS